MDFGASRRISIYVCSVSVTGYVENLTSSRERSDPEVMENRCEHPQNSGSLT